MPVAQGRDGGGTLDSRTTLVPPAAGPTLYTAFAVLLPFAVRGVALLQAHLGRVMLTSRAATQAEVGRLTEGRNAAVAAEAVALRRLERDIHDGPQQQLVRLHMDLTRAQRTLECDPDAAVARMLVVTPGAVEKHTQHIFARLGLAQDEDQHRRVMATPAYLRGWGISLAKRRTRPVDNSRGRRPLRPAATGDPRGVA